MALPVLAIITAVISVASAAYSFYLMRKQRKKNKPVAQNQIDGSIADEGTSFTDIAGTYPIHMVIVDKYGERSEEIRERVKGGK